MVKEVAGTRIAPQPLILPLISLLPLDTLELNSLHCLLRFFFFSFFLIVTNISVVYQALTLSPLSLSLLFCDLCDQSYVLWVLEIWTITANGSGFWEVWEGVFIFLIFFVPIWSLFFYPFNLGFFSIMAWSIFYELGEILGYRFVF